MIKSIKVDQCLHNAFFGENASSLVIEKDKLKNICKIDSGVGVCRYIVVFDNKYRCAKNVSMGRMIDNLVDKKIMVANGDNCEGQKKKDV